MQSFESDKQSMFRQTEHVHKQSMFRQTEHVRIATQSLRLLGACLTVVGLLIAFGVLAKPTVECIVAIKAYTITQMEVNGK